jgi:hypothetical protein
VVVNPIHEDCWRFVQHYTEPLMLCGRSRRKDVGAVTSPAVSGQTLLAHSRPAERRSCIRRLEAKETEAIPLVKRTPLALDIDCRDLTTRVRSDEVCGECAHHYFHGKGIIP